VDETSTPLDYYSPKPNRIKNLSPGRHLLLIEAAKRRKQLSLPLVQRFSVLPAPRLPDLRREPDRRTLFPQVGELRPGWIANPTPRSDLIRYFDQISLPQTPVPQIPTSRTPATTYTSTTPGTSDTSNCKMATLNDIRTLMTTGLLVANLDRKIEREIGDLMKTSPNTAEARQAELDGEKTWRQESRDHNR
jgi:hypothetical protein